MNIYKYINENFNYDNGVITRTDRKNSEGSFDKDGYLILKIKGTHYKAHRIVWLMHNGEFPKGEIDHINRNRTDNRIENLRVVDRKTNANNVTKKINNDTGVVGVYIDRTKGLKKKYATRINNKTYRFYSVKEAVEFRGGIYNEN